MAPFRKGDKILIKHVSELWM